MEDENGVGSPFNDSDLHYDDDESQGSVYDAARPYVYYLAYEDGVARMYERVFKAEEEQETDYSIGTRYFSARFEVPNRSPATAATLLESFLPDMLLDGWVQCTNDYAKARLPPYQAKVVTRSEVLLFLGFVTYAGVVHVPSK